MKHKYLLSLMVSALLAGTVVHAEDGTITFTGTISDSSCTISSDSKTIDVDFGSVSQQALGLSASDDVVKKFSINLLDCPSAISNAVVSWTGTTTSDSNARLATYLDGSITTDDSVTYELQDKAGNSVNFDGSAAPAISLVPGDNKLEYAAMYVTYVGSTVPVGEYTADATYSITYN